jgi:hypothetical protein
MHVEAWQDFTSAEVGSKDKRWLGLRRPNLKLSYSCMGDSLDTSAGFHRILCKPECDNLNPSTGLRFGTSRAPYLQIRIPMKPGSQYSIYVSLQGPRNLEVNGTE